VPQPFNPQALNRFSYTYNNPINLIDPSGHCAYEDLPDGSQQPDLEGDGDCWKKLRELEDKWGVDILDEDLWDLPYLLDLEFIMESYAKFLGADLWRSILAIAARKGGKDKFIVRGRMGEWDDTGRCPLGCSRFGEIRFNLDKIFSRNPGAAGGLGWGNSDITGNLEARIIIAHEFAHQLIWVMGENSINSAYMNFRNWNLVEIGPSSMNYRWVAGDGGIPIAGYDPKHNLIAVIALYIAGDNTWNFAYFSAATSADREFLMQLRFMWTAEY
jgi:hypothetical protein